MLQYYTKRTKMYVQEHHNQPNGQYPELLAHKVHKLISYKVSVEMS